MWLRKCKNQNMPSCPRFRVEFLFCESIQVITSSGYGEFCSGPRIGPIGGPIVSGRRAAKGGMRDALGSCGADIGWHGNEKIKSDNTGLECISSAPQVDERSLGTKHRIPDRYGGSPWTDGIGNRFRLSPVEWLNECQTGGMNGASVFQKREQGRRARGEERKERHAAQRKRRQ